MRLRLLVPVFLLLFVLSAQDRPPQSLTNKAVIATKDEPGERLILKGTLYGSDGSTPLPNIKIYAYQTDATGVYSRPVDDSRNPRLKAWAKTDAQGRFEFDTIKPASYPGGGNPAHIHVVLYEGERQSGVDECWFEGDRYLTASMKQREEAAGKFSRILRISKDANGVWRGEWNLRLRNR